MPQVQMVYASAATRPFTQPELRLLLLKARANNGKLGITGLLLYLNSSFFQILEGPTEDVTSLFERIKLDKRHDRVLLLSSRETEERNFGDWSMGFIDVDLTAKKLSGFVKLLAGKTSFVDLQGDKKLISKLIEGFQDGRWRQIVEQ